MGTPAIAAARPGTQTSSTLVVWGGLTLLGALLLPWARPGRSLFVFTPGTLGYEILTRDWTVAMVIVCGVIAGSLGVAPLPLFRRGRLALVIGSIGVLATIWSLVARGAPMGPGPLVAVLSFLALIGIGLALGGYIHADAFICVCIVWAAAFVATFILYPLFAVLQASVFVNGRFTLQVIL
jgi:hypothetical protein